MLQLLYSQPVQQLNRIKQLGPTFMVYPGATHTRLNHSLGVLHLARRMIRVLLTANSAPRVTLEGVKSFLCAALLHDVGHFPYTHSLKELPLLDHEQLTGRIIQSDPIRSILKDIMHIDPAMTAAIVDLSLPDDGNDEIRFFRRILSSPLDPDKLDYLNRDAYYCGVPYGIQDTDYVLSQIIPHPEFGIGLRESGLSALEHLLFSKYLMYRAVYWHRDVRIATGMIKKALYTNLQNGNLQPQQLYNLDDESFFALLTNQPDARYMLIERVRQRRFFVTALEIPFSANNPAHSALTDLATRTEIEQHIAELISAPLLIDIPEAISFEIDMPVRVDDGWITYNQARSVFTPEVVRDFTAALRLIRIAVDPSILPLSPAITTACMDILNNGMG